MKKFKEIFIFGVTIGLLCMCNDPTAPSGGGGGGGGSGGGSGSAGASQPSTQTPQVPPHSTQPDPKPEVQPQPYTPPFTPTYTAPKPQPQAPKVQPPLTAPQTNLPQPRSVPQTPNGGGPGLTVVPPSPDVLAPALKSEPMVPKPPPTPTPVTKHVEVLGDLTPKGDLYIDLNKLNFEFSRNCFLLVKLYGAREEIRYYSRECPNDTDAGFEYPVATFETLISSDGKSGQVLVKGKPAGTFEKFPSGINLYHLCNRDYRNVCKIEASADRKAKFFVPEK